ncbi:MAG: hypothetical protein B7Y99_02535 [Caulobacterales bacterium 32-69-10]|nr:MAG: hypothetical protein B7Y99_02535 [Caulobacterales bacterium 32-69-10]
MVHIRVIVQGRSHVRFNANVKVRMPDEMVERLSDAACEAGCSVPEMLRASLLPEIRKASLAELTIQRQPPQARPRVMTLRPDLVDALTEVAAATYATKGEVLYTFLSRFLAGVNTGAPRGSVMTRTDRSFEVSAAA